VAAEIVQLLSGEFEVGGAGRVCDAVWTGHAGDGNDGRGKRHLPGQADLLRTDSVLVGDLLEDTTISEGAGAADAAERTPRQKRQAQLGAQLQLVLAGPESGRELVLHRDQPESEEAVGEADLLFAPTAPGSSTSTTTSSATSNSPTKASTCAPNRDSPSPSTPRNHPRRPPTPSPCSPPGPPLKSTKTPPPNQASQSTSRSRNDPSSSPLTIGEFWRSAGYSSTGHRRVGVNGVLDMSSTWMTPDSDRILGQPLIKVDFVPLSGSDHAVSIAGSATSTSSSAVSAAARHVNVSSPPELDRWAGRERCGRDADRVAALMAE
jgi:hypothetical protein